MRTEERVVESFEVSADHLLELAACDEWRILDLLATPAGYLIKAERVHQAEPAPGPRLPYRDD